MPSSFPRLATVIRIACVTALLGAFAACDRHPAAEPERDYGHGSSHEKSYDNHSIDSTKGGSHFSDTKGYSGEKEETAKEAASPQPSASQKPFNTGEGQ